MEETRDRKDDGRPLGGGGGREVPGEGTAKDYSEGRGQGMVRRGEGEKDIDAMSGLGEAEVRRKREKPDQRQKQRDPVTAVWFNEVCQTIGREKI